MRGVQKSKRVSWATDGNLCQVRLFLSEDSPSLAGADLQDHLQAKKKTSVLHGTGSGSDDVLPPGFEGVNSENQELKHKLVRIPLIKWRCPPKFALDAAWRVVAGEGSKEVEAQNVRELRVLEAIYPRSSTIPPDPHVSLEIKNSVYDDRATPFVPITPIEEEEGIEDSPNTNSPPAGGAPTTSLLPGFPQSLSHATPTTSSDNAVLATISSQPQLLAAATAALSAVASSNQPGKMINHELLVKILSNPTLLENLAKNHGNNSLNTTTTTTTSMPSTPAAAQSSSTTTTIHVTPPLHHPVGFSLVDSSSAAASTSKDKFFTSRSTTIFNPSPPVQRPHHPPSAPAITGAGMPSFPGGKSINAPSAPAITGAGMPSFPGGKSINAPSAPGITGAGMPSFPGGKSINAPPPTKDLNYYKSLIQQHGGDRHSEAGPAAVPPPPFPGHLHNFSSNQHNMNHSEYSRNLELKPKFPKPCAFFNSARGCWHGANCLFQHDGPMIKQQQRMGSNIEMPHGAKRIKTDNREMRGHPQPYM